MSKTDLADFFPQTVPKKYPRALGDIPPPHKSAHNDILCTDSKGNQAKQDKPARRSLAAVPLPSSAGSDVSALCIDRTGRGNNRIHTTEKHNEKASQKGKQTSKQAQARELASMLAILIQAKQITPLYILYSEKHINRQAREKRKAILFPSMPIYRIAIYYNKAI